MTIRPPDGLAQMPTPEECLALKPNPTDESRPSGQPGSGHQQIYAVPTVRLQLPIDKVPSNGNYQSKSVQHLALGDPMISDKKLTNMIIATLLAASASLGASEPVIKIDSMGEWQAMRWGVLGHNIGGEDWHGSTPPWNGRPVLWDKAIHAPDKASDTVTHTFPLHWLRFNAGNEYAWRKLIGPVEERQSWTMAWGMKSLLEPGFDDFLRWAESLPTPPRVTLIVGPTQPIEDIRDWVLYLNAIAGPMAKLRAANGHSAPYNIRTFELGNEVDWSGRADQDIMRKDSDNEKIGMLRPEDYVRLFRPRVLAMRAADPKLRIFAHAKTAPSPSSNWADWHRQILPGLGDVIDGISLHPYYDGYSVSTCAGFLDTLIADVRTYNTDKKRKLSIWVSEHGKWWHEKNDGQVYGLAGAISTADFLIEVLKRPEIEAATAWCYAHLGPWRVIERDRRTGKWFGTGLFHLFKLLNTAALDEMHPLQLTMPQGLGGHVANALWFREKKSGGRQSLIVVNRSKTGVSAKTSVPLPRTCDATLLLVTADDPKATNTPQAPDSVHMNTSKVRLNPGADGKLSMDVPPHCIAAWIWQ